MLWQAIFIHDSKGLINGIAQVDVDSALHAVIVFDRDVNIDIAAMEYIAAQTCQIIQRTKVAALARSPGTLEVFAPVELDIDLLWRQADIVVIAHFLVGLVRAGHSILLGLLHKR